MQKNASKGASKRVASEYTRQNASMQAESCKQPDKKMQANKQKMRVDRQEKCRHAHRAASVRVSKVRRTGKIGKVREIEI